MPTYYHDAAARTVRSEDLWVSTDTKGTKNPKVTGWTIGLSWSEMSATDGRSQSNVLGDHRQDFQAGQDTEATARHHFERRFCGRKGIVITAGEFKELWTRYEADWKATRKKP